MAKKPTAAQLKKRADRAEKRRAFVAGLLDMTGLDELIAKEIKGYAKSKLPPAEKHAEVKDAILVWLDEVATPFPISTPRGFANEIATDIIIRALDKSGVLDHLITKVYDELYP